MPLSVSFANARRECRCISVQADLNAQKKPANGGLYT
jgi:hypothetical protein